MTLKENSNDEKLPNFSKIEVLCDILAGTAKSLKEKESFSAETN